MGYFSLCKICNSTARTKIEALYETTTYAKIVEQINAKYPELKLIPANLSNHRKHVEPTTPSPQPTEVVDSKQVTDYSFESIESMPDLTALDVIDFKIKEIWTAQKKRKLSPAEEQLLRAFVELKVRAESLNLSKSQITTSKQESEAERAALKLLERLNQSDTNGTKNSGTEETS